MVTSNVSEVAKAAHTVSRDIAMVRATGEELKQKASTLRGASGTLDGSVQAVRVQLGHFRID